MQYVAAAFVVAFFWVVDHNNSKAFECEETLRAMSQQW